MLRSTHQTVHHATDEEAHDEVSEETADGATLRERRSRGQEETSTDGARDGDHGAHTRRQRALRAVVTLTGLRKLRVAVLERILVVHAIRLLHAGLKPGALLAAVVVVDAQLLAHCGVGRVRLIWVKWMSGSRLRI
jgi:hypothetical protein